MNYAPDDTEQKAIALFCSEYVENKVKKEEIKDKKLNLSEEKIVLEEQLMEYMKSVRQTCIPISVDNKDMYLRLMKTKAKRSIGDTTLEEMVNKLTEDVIITVAESLEEELERKPTIYEVLCEAVCISMDETCSYHRENVIITPSKERSKKEERPKKKRKGEEEDIPRVHKLTKDIKKLTLRYHRVCEDLKLKASEGKNITAKMEAMTKNREDQKSKEEDQKSKEEDQNSKEEEEETELVEPSTPTDGDYQQSRNVISTYLSRINPEKKSAKLSVNVNNEPGTYFLKEKQYSKLKAFRVREFKPTVKKVIHTIFSKCKVDTEIAFDQDNVKDVLDPNLLKYLVTQLSDAVYERRQQISVPVNGISLDKAPDRKRNTLESDRRAMEENTLQDDDDDDGDLPETFEEDG